MVKPTSHRDVIAIGASAGGFDVLLELAARLPADLPAAVLIVLHIGSHPSRLPELLSARGPNRAVHPKSGQRLEHGTIYVAPSDHHMLLQGDAIKLTRTAKENNARPAIDPLFRSVALACGSRAIGVVLSGHLDDGTAGAQAIKQCGGLIVVQDPDDAQQPSMPASVRENVAVDHCVPSASLADTLIELIGRPAARPVSAPIWVSSEQRVSEGETDPMEDLDCIGKPSVFSCPDCDGVLWEIADAKPRRFRCHTGHAFSLQSLEHSQAANSNRALWGALRSLQERETLLAQRVADNRQQHHADEAVRLEAQLRDLAQQTRQLQGMIVAA